MVGVSHAGFKKQDDVFLVGDSVAILLERKTKRKCNLARILRLYEDQTAKWAEVLWYRHPRQTSYGEGYPYHKEVANEHDEFFLTDSMERVELDTIERKARRPKHIGFPETQSPEPGTLPWRFLC